MTSAVDLRKVGFSYDGHKQVLRNLSFTVQIGSLAALLGPNGSGKSTSFKLLSTQLLAWSGEARLAGFDLRTQRAEIRKNLGVCFQSPSLDKILNVRENLMLHGKVLGLRSAEISKEIEELCRAFQVDYMEERVEHLSGGQARRVEIIKAFLGSPKLLILDEPTNGLDPLARRNFWLELAAVARRKMATVMVTTHLVEEASLCNELIILNEGTCVAQGHPEALRQSLGFEILQVSFADWIEKRAPLQAQLRSPERMDIVGDHFRIATKRPRELFEWIRSQWSDEIERMEWAKPSLTDVYFEKTGKVFS